MLEIAIHNPRQHRQFQHETGPLLLARSTNDRPLWTPVNLSSADEVESLVEIVRLADGIRLQVAGCEQECDCDRSSELVGDSRLALPARFSIGDTRFEIIADDSRESSALSRPLEELAADRSQRVGLPSSSSGPSTATLSRWFDALGTLHHWASSLQEFFVQAARCAVEAISLDGAIVLRRRDNGWEIVASHLPHPELGIHCERRALDQLIERPRTLFHGTGRRDTDGEAETFEVNAPADLSQEVALVLSPLFNAAHELAGAIYGFRTVQATNQRRGIRYLEANMIELLANAVSQGIARVEHEAEVDRRRVLSEQALAAMAAQDPNKMVSERREITLLFADLRDFSNLSNTLGVEQTYALLGDVMDALTAAVMDHDGLVIDYFGDGLAAMWNAPESQADHPELACRAGLRMLETLPVVREKWSHVLTKDLRLGIGVHTGVAQVGNAGSNRRMKYGPRGESVHLAARVEAASKLIGVPLVVTRAAAARLSNRLVSYRICRAQLPGIAEPVDLFGVRQATAEPVATAQLAKYKRALEAFEAGRLEETARTLNEIDATSGVPTAFLAAQTDLQLRGRERRRSSDSTSHPGPVIFLNVK